MARRSLQETATRLRHHSWSFVVEINYGQSIVKLHPRAGYQRQENFAPITLDGYLPKVPASIRLTEDLTLQGQFLVDTGAVDERSLSWKSSQYMMLHAAKLETKKATVAEIKVSGASLAQPEMHLLEESIHDGMIGAGFLKHCKCVTIDYHGKRMWLEQ